VKDALTNPRHEGSGWRRDGSVFLACMLLFGLRAGRGTRSKGASLLALLVILAGGNTTGSGDSGTTAGIYTVTVTGTSGATVESSTVTLTVQ
jgi:hypothetical protein